MPVSVVLRSVRVCVQAWSVQKKRFAECEANLTGALGQGCSPLAVGSGTVVGIDIWKALSAALSFVLAFPFVLVFLFASTLFPMCASV